MQRFATQGVARALSGLHRRRTCRGCGSPHLHMFLSLGDVPLANAYLRKTELEKPEPHYPLEVFVCDHCQLVQLLHVVSPKILFSRYPYRTGTNATITEHNAALAASIINRLELPPDSLIIEIASNDGSLLQQFKQRGMRVLGIEPAANIARIARRAGVTTINKFFNLECAARVERRFGLAPVVIANNVLAHVDDTVDFLSACRTLLNADGRLIVEAPYLGELLARMEFDTIYHEHLCYFSIGALLQLYAKARLSIERIERNGIHGGSLRIWARPWDARGHSAAVLAMAEDEAKAGRVSGPALQTFARGVRENRHVLQVMLQRLKEQGKSVAAYGAPAKGNTLLCYGGITDNLISYTVDRSPLKIGLFLPGSHIPVFPVERVFEKQPDYLLILAWNFADEIIKDLEQYRQRGGKFILPVPEPRIVS